MKEKYRGKVKVPFCVEYSSINSDDLFSLLSEISEGEIVMGGRWNYYGIAEDSEFDGWNEPQSFGENTTIYTLEELQAIVDEANKEESLTSEVWIDWKGGDCPVSANTLVDVKFENGSFNTNTSAGCYDWEHSDYCYQITAYRIVNTPTASCSDDTDTLPEDEYVDVGEDETVSNERLKLIGKHVVTKRHPTQKGLVNGIGWEPNTYEIYYPWTGEDEGELVRTGDIMRVLEDSDIPKPTTIKANVSFDVTIKGQTFNLTPEELQDLYLQLCVAEGTLQDWRLGQ